jgi:hypothetical protein
MSETACVLHFVFSSSVQMKSSALNPLAAKPAIPPIAANHVGSRTLPVANLNAIRTVTTIAPAAGS